MASTTARSGGQQTTQTSSRPPPSLLLSSCAPFFPSEHLSSPFLPPSAAATAPLSLSACLLFAPSPSHLLTSSYLQQRRRHYAPQAWQALLSSLSASSTLYLGNLAFSTREETVLEAAMVATQQLPPRLYMGVNAVSHTPCGFCFLSFPSAAAARRARWWLDGLRVDGRLLQADFDQEFKPGRQLGRGKGGGQIRDDHRSGFDGGRGGWGTRERRQQQMRLMEQQQLSHFRPMQAADSRVEEEKKEEGAEAGAEAEARVQQRRDNVSYAHASAMRRAGGAAAVIPAAVTESSARAEPEAATEEEDEAGRASQSRCDAHSRRSLPRCLTLSAPCLDARVIDVTGKRVKLDGVQTEEPAAAAAAQDGHEHEAEQAGETNWSTAEEEKRGRGEGEDDTAYREGDSASADGESWDAAAERGGDGSYDRGGDRMDEEEQQEERREEEEVEHGFAAADDETADPSWS